MSMDPDAAREEMRRLLADRDGQREQGDDYIGTLERIAEHAQALDEWLGKGGFLPDAWDHQTRIWTLQGEQVRDLAADVTDARTFRLSVDWGELKWKRNEDTWTAGMEADKPS